MKIGIIGAMEVEVRDLKEKMHDVTVQKIANLTFYTGNFNGVQTVLVQSGIGKVNAAMCATLLIASFNVTHIINTGVAGGMRTDLHIFDIVVSSDAMYHDFDTTEFGYPACTVPGLESSIFAADAALVACAKAAYAEGNFDKKIVEGRIASGDIFVNSAELKERIRTLCNPACVEMEGAAIAHVCNLHNVPFVVIRCISDMAENTDEVYHEEKAASVSGFLVAHMLTLLGSGK